MSQFSILLSFVASLLIVAPSTYGDPADLLNQAIEENQTPAKPEKAKEEVRSLISQADRLIEQKKFNKAIDLYQKAYRLSPSDQNNYVRLLIAKRAAGRMTEQDRQALDLIQQQQAADVVQVFRRVRLKMIQTREALRQSDTDLAKAIVKNALESLDGIPKDIDTSPYRRQLMQLLNDAYRKTNRRSKPVDHNKATTTVGHTLVITSERDDPASQNPPSLMEAQTQIDAISPQELESGEIIDVQKVLNTSRERHFFDRELSEAIRRNRAQTILNNNEAAFPPQTDMTFPKDWRERTRRRAGYRDGLIHKGKPFTDKDGKTRYTAIYDIGDLLHPVPNFYASYPGSVRRQRFENLDRHYIRERSQIFNGYAEDLAEGLPLLHFFGGIDNNAVSTRTDPRERERIMQILDRFIHEHQ